MLGCLLLLFVDKRMTDSPQQPAAEPAPDIAGHGEPSVAARAMRGSVYSIAASLITWTSGAVRLVLLTRFLLPADVGVFTQAMVFVVLAARIYNFGLNVAVVHRQDEAGNLLPTYFSLRLILMTISLGGLALLTPWIGSWYNDMPLLAAVMLALIAAEVLNGLNDVQLVIMDRRLAFRRGAAADVISSLAMTLVAPLMAWQGLGVWALVGEQASGFIARSLVVWTGGQHWRAQVGWQSDTARWLIRYSGTVWFGGNLTYVLDRFDDFWIGQALGATQLGFYARAYEFARYSRRVVANPILGVFFPTYARLQQDRARLSRAFFRATSLMIRSGGLFSLVFVLTAPEFIPLILGKQWLPMLTAFQLMIVYTFLDPIALSAIHLLTATGHPQQVLRIRAIQTAFFIPAVIIASQHWGIEGVAIVADLMMLLGTLFLFGATRYIVDYSQTRLWLWPLVAVIGVGAVTLALTPLWRSLSPWAAWLGKGLLITGMYVGILWLTERKQIRSAWQMVWGALPPRLQQLRNR